MIKSIIAVAMGLTLTGCLVTVDSNSRPIHTVWDDGDITRLELGSSNQEWVQNSFGEPVSKLNYADGSEIWKYRNRSEKDMEVGLFLVFSVDIESERVETLSIEFLDGLVSNYWVEEVRY
ncbi:MAG TPA: hypothetical protein DCL66_02400 [Gammaproteobacteria bacterium]|nr:hypothetical protein [Gammaproteobacteria bacterium]|tara:strand:- start:194 stop:553 length:360 start_codon:yes stop_codon:yes gene_type:complete